MKFDPRAEAVATLSAWRAPSHDQDALRHAFLALLDARDDACRRDCLAGHLTASALVLDPTGTHTCLVHHRLVDAWLQPGGHLEPGDGSLAAAALREVREETGLPDVRLDPEPLQLHAHPITCRGSGPTRHLDVRFLAVAPQVSPVVSSESHDVRWWSVAQVPPGLFPEVRDLVHLAGQRLERTGER